MEKDQLITHLSQSPEGRMVHNLSQIIQHSNIRIKDVLDLNFHPKKEVAFRSAWMLEYIFVLDPDAFAENISFFLASFPLQKNPSAMRLYAKIAAMMTDKKCPLIIKEELQRQDPEPIIDVLFSWLIDENVLVATKAHCMQALANLAPDYDWIKEELLQTIDHLIDKESIAFFAKVKQVKKALKKVK